MAEHSENGENCALKFIRKKDDESNHEQVMNEVNVMRNLSHPNVVNLIEFNDTKEFVDEKGRSNPVYAIAMELASGGELFDFLIHTGAFSEKVARYYFHQLWDAFEDFHGHGISHRDLKPENILLDGEFNLKVADFGLASLKNKNKTTTGSVSYMAPEILLGKSYSGKWVDLFAAGAILFIMTTWSPPFREASHKDKKYLNIGANKPTRFWKHHSKNREGGIDYFTPEFRELVTQLLSFSQYERPSLAEVKESEWYNGPVPTPEEMTEELSRRKGILDKSLNQGEMDIPDSEADPEIFQGKEVHRGQNDSEEEKDLEDVDRTWMAYIPDCKRYTQFFSSSDIESLFNTLATYVDSCASEFRFSQKEYSWTFSIINEESSLTMTVNILEASDEIYCVEAVRKSCDIFEFNKVFSDMKEYFGGHLNATEPE